MDSKLNGMLSLNKVTDQARGYAMWILLEQDDFPTKI